MKVVTIVGARPQFIKAASVTRAFEGFPEVKELLVHTGQHYDSNMSDIFFEELEIPRPAYQLGIGSGSHGAQTGQMLTGIEEVLTTEQPDWVMVYGDTNSTLAGALAAAKLHIPIAHIEAGLRSFNRKMPEEINRVLTDHASTLLFTPTEVASNNLKREGIDKNRIFYTGDVMYDAALFYEKKAESKSHILTDLKVISRQFVLATIHRAENTNDAARLTSIFDALNKVSREIPVVMPLHPRTRKFLQNLGISASNIKIIDPVGYLDMIMLEKNARLIATDSGGVQKEAYFYRVPCVTLRDETEWTELIEHQWNHLISPVDSEEIFAIVMEHLDMPGKEIALYGGGNAAYLVAKALYNMKQ
jgi:UDP-GlcNAc3NAcA epimerase